ncbi:DUF5825 family protein [Phytohabitans rumicis]|uniref:Uncharacterized protein n=1 Tax=Phytohabitans rumicis TaxID=1076125 RepID=A0A6V8L8S4_9ACTN|nr:DUF5825 family protein [Phytohabitans rumicis]GFJ93642.1 hypothetical protein Prum_072840 [Phytohabitans rumicis]
MSQVKVDAPIALGAEPRSTASFVAFLRDSATNLISVEWHGTITGALDPTLLHHLQPPTQLEAASEQTLTQWRTRYRYGTCHYRRGPGFVMLKDIRSASSAARYLLDDPLLIATFLRCQTPTTRSSLNHRQRHAVDLLHTARLLLRMDDLLIGLPTRMLRWPIPYTAV